MPEGCAIPFQRLHYSAALVIWSVPMVVLAIWIENPDWQARTKSVLIFLVLFCPPPDSPFAHH